MIKYRKKILNIAIGICTIFVTTMSSYVTSSAEGTLEGPDVYAEGYCVMDADTGEVIIQKNMNEKFHPASITKTLTALVVLEEDYNLRDTITFSDNAIHSLSADSSTLPPMAQVGEQMSVKDVLYGMMLSSANECSNALAEYIAGSTEKFAKLMNEKAKEVGAKNSHFVNAHGLDDENHYTTPYDMAMIFKAGLENKMFKKIVSTPTYTIEQTNMTPARNLEMGHRMVNGNYQCDGVFAGKTGRTPLAGRTLLTAATRDGRTLISVVMKSNDDEFYNDTAIILEYGFGIASGKMEPVVWQDAKETIWATGNVKIREFPSVYSKEKGILQKGQSIERIATYGDWCKIQVGDNIYYVSNDYVTNIDPSKPPEETSEEITTEEVVTSEETTEKNYKNGDGNEYNEENVSSSQERSSYYETGLTLVQSNARLLLLVGGIVVIGVITIIIVRGKKRKKKDIYRF